MDGDIALIFAILILVIFFYGDPDIADAIIHSLMK